MRSYIDLAKRYISENPVLFEDAPFQTLIELLWYFYTQYHPIKCDTVQVHFSSLEHILKPLSQKRRRQLLNSVSRLCNEYELAAFLEGIRVGFQLFLELTKQEEA